MEQLAMDLTLLGLPSPMWAIHIYPKNEFIAILHIKVTSNEIIVDKGVILVEEKDKLELKIFINGFIAQLPNNTSGVTISGLSSLLFTLHNRNLCLNASDNVTHPNCLKLVENKPHDSQSDCLNYCDMCMSESEIKEIHYKVELDNKEFKKAIENDINEDESVNELVDRTSQGRQITKKKGLCNICGKILSSQYRIEEHMLTHTLEKKYRCGTCCKTFAKSFNLRMHEHIHSGERPYVCATCEKTYTTNSNLRTHTLSCHKEQKRHICEICNMAFVYPRYLKLHMRKHTGERPYVCSVCRKKFSKNIHLTVHMRTHTGERPYCCTFCGKCFTATGGLTSHKKSHHRVD